MATTAYSTLRQNFNKLFGSYYAGSTSGAGGTTSLVATALQAWDQAKDDFYNDMWVRVTSGTVSGDERLVSDYTASSGTVVPRPNFSGTPGASATFELMTYEPAMVLEAFKRAIDTCYPTLSRKGLFRQLYDESNTTNGWLWNAHFEDWNLTTIPDHFAKQGTATVSEETTIIRGPKGSSSVKLTGGGATDYIYQSQVENPGLLDLQGKTVTFYVGAYAAVASTARLTIAYKIASGTSLTTASSSYHSGNSEYELLQKEVTLPNSITDLQVRLESGGGTVYFENLFLKNAPTCYRYHLSKDLVHEPKQVWVQGNDASGTDNYGCTMISGAEQWLPLPRSAWSWEDNGTDSMLIFNSVAYLGTSCRKIRVMGYENLSTPSTDASTVEVANEHARVLVALAAAEMAETLAKTSTMADNQVTNLGKRASELREEAEALLQTHGMAKPYNVFNGLVN